MRREAHPTLIDLQTAAANSDPLDLRRSLADPLAVDLLLADEHRAV